MLSQPEVVEILFAKNNTYNTIMLNIYRQTGLVDVVIYGLNKNKQQKIYQIT